MYIVVDKKTKEVIHVNPTPLDHELTGQDVYFQFDPRRMEIVRSARRELPPHFEIKDGELVEPPVLPEHGPHEKIVDGKVVPKTLAEKVADGLIKIEPTHKVAGDRIVEKSAAEKVADGLIKLRPEEKVEGDAIVRKAARELLQEKRITLADIKKERLQQFSSMALQLRAAILPDFKLQNAALGIYDEPTVAAFKATVEAFRDEFHRIEQLINDAKSLDAIEAIKEQFPRTPAEPGPAGEAKPRSGQKKK